MVYNDYELLYLIEDNDEIAYKIMLEKYKPVIINKAKKYYAYLKSNNYSAILLEDFIIKGYECFHSSIKLFDVNRGYLFYSFFSTCLDSCYKNYMRQFLAKKNQPLLHYQELDFEIQDVKQADPYEYVDTVYLEENIKDYFYSIDIIDRAILELRLNDFRYQEITKLLGVSSSKISRVVKEFKNYLYKKGLTEVI